MEEHENENIKKTTADYVESIFTQLILGAIVITALFLGFKSCSDKHEEDQMIREALKDILKERIEAGAVK